MDSDKNLVLISTGVGLEKNKNTNLLMCIIIAVFIFLMFIPWDKIQNNIKKENMTGGTLAQLYAKDSQDAYLNVGEKDIQAGNYTLFWNQPTRVANTFMNRGTPLSSIYLPNTSMNPTKEPIISSNKYTDNVLNKPSTSCKNKNLTKIVDSTKTFPNPLQTFLNPSKSSKNKSELNIENTSFNNNPNVLQQSLNPNLFEKIGKQIATCEETSDNLPTMVEYQPVDYLYQAYHNNASYNLDCRKDPSACGNGFGSADRLTTGFVEPTRAKTKVNIDGNIFYPDSYVGSYWHPLNFDINRPIQFMPTTNLPQDITNL